MHFLIESLQPSHCVSPRGTEMCKGRELGPIEITLFVMPTSESDLWKHSLDLELLITDKKNDSHYYHIKKLIFFLASIGYAFERNAYCVGLVDNIIFE